MEKKRALLDLPIYNIYIVILKKIIKKSNSYFVLTC